MTTVSRTFDVRPQPAVVIDYLKDFGHAEEWDPGTESCTRQDSGPVQVGSSWHNVSKIAGVTTELTYTLQPGTMSLTHTYVPRSFEGRGIAGRMTRAALEYAERNRLEVIPVCSFAVSYMARHARKSERT